MQIPLDIGIADVAGIVARQGDGWEAAARTARYDFLRETAERLGARFVAVGHTADDQVETVLHRILRGTGIAGLSGIPAIRSLSASVSVVRPILAARRRNVLDYLVTLGQDFRTDTTNADPRWTRNRLRMELLPALRDYYNADVDAALLRLAAQAAEAQGYIARVAGELADGRVVVDRGEQGSSGVRIDCRQLAAQPSLIVREVCKVAWQEAGWPLQAMGFDEWQQLAALIHEASDVRDANFPSNVRAHRESDALILTRRVLP